MLRSQRRAKRWCGEAARTQGGRGIIGCRDKRGRKGDWDVPFRILSVATHLGDWNGDGVDEIGVYRPSVRRFFMDTDGDFIWDPAVDVTAAFGSVGDQSIVGKW